MIDHSKKLFFIVLTAIPMTVLGVDLQSIDGIWQDQSRENSYYAVSQNEDTIILINLSRLEAGGNTFAATYIGSKSDLLLTPLAAFPVSPFDQIPLRINFTSDTEATIFPECDVCFSLGVNLTKIFK